MVPQIMNAALMMNAVVAPRGPNRSAAHIRAGNAM